jgi:hypothetical protein
MENLGSHGRDLGTKSVKILALFYWRGQGNNMWDGASSRYSPHKNVARKSFKTGFSRRFSIVNGNPVLGL